MLNIKNLGTALKINTTFVQKANLIISIGGEKLYIKHNNRILVDGESLENIFIDEEVSKDINELLSKLETLIK